MSTHHRYPIDMRLIVRVIAMLVVVPATYFFIYWVPLSLSPFSNSGIPSLLCAAGVGWYVWKKLGSTPADAFSCTLLGAILLGAVGFCAGFFGPMILASGGNQGPLLGIFLTGPLGFILGGIGGFVYWLAKGRKTRVN